MSFEQVKFVSNEWEPDVHPMGGIAMYDEDGVLCYVLSGADGAYYYPDEISILRHYDNWLDISDEIIGNEFEG